MLKRKRQKQERYLLITLKNDKIKRYYIYDLSTKRVYKYEVNKAYYLTIEDSPETLIKKSKKAIKEVYGEKRIEVKQTFPPKRFLLKLGLGADGFALEKIVTSSQEDREFNSPSPPPAKRRKKCQKKL